MDAYKTKSSKLPGTGFRDVHTKAYNIYKTIKNNTKRRTYIRSAYFGRQKIFIDIFWRHLFEKPNWRDRVRRLKYFPPALELIINSRFAPEAKENPNRKSEILHRFCGITKENELFFVQIKEDKKTNQKYLISIFPDK